ncbi:MAG: hypothetical protein ABI934_06905 [Actinomycetota bacterium]
MSGHPTAVEGLTDTAEFKQTLLGRLGLRADASDQDVEAAHNGVVDFLELAPKEVKSWAAVQTADVDEAFALLSGPELDLVPAAAVASSAQVSLDKASPTPAPPAPVAAPAPSAPTGFASLAANKPLQKKLMLVAVPLLIIAVVFAVFQSGKGSDVPGLNGTPTNQETTAAGPAPVDQAKVGALMTKISANPKDVASLQGLGNLYFAAADYKNAIVWEQKILGVDPKNKIALISIGAAQFNSGDQAGAKKNWLVAAGLYPKEAEVHYDLGFLYMSQTPPDLVNQKIEWAKVVAIDPTSALAKSVGTHITGTKPTPTATSSAK